VSARSGHRVQMRWQDIDGLGHVNHVVVLTYLEEGRDAFLARHGIRRDEYVVGRCTVDYRDEIESSADAVTVQCAVRELGRSSVTTHERVLDRGGRVVVEAEFVIVLWDPVTRGSRPLSPSERTSLSAAIETGQIREEARR
jgi:acyl-CoA thioester hydrolase